MPLFDFRCTRCQAEFELLVRSTTPASCPHCGETRLDKLPSLISPRSTTQKQLQKARTQAAREGHFSHYSAAEKPKT